MSSAKIMWVQMWKNCCVMWIQVQKKAEPKLGFWIICHLQFEGRVPLLLGVSSWLIMTSNRWVVRKGSVSATAATSCATPPPPSSPPSPPSPPSSRLSSSFSPFPSPSPPFLPSPPPPSSSLWPISRQIRLLLPQGVNPARELYHNYFAFRTKHMLQLVFHTEIKDFL